MSNSSQLTLNYKNIIGQFISWTFGILAFTIGIVNMFWGNDTVYGIMIFILSFVFFPPVTVVFKKITGFSIPLFVKIILALFIVWTSLGVGELFDKISLMMKDLR